ncbi:MAG: alpha-2-macroglobulin family protein [Planctomycetota bacterium]
MPRQPRRYARPNAQKAICFALLYPLLAVLLVALTGPMAGLQAQDQEDADEPKEKPKTLTGVLGGEERYLTHVSTDKPIYRGGETVYVRGVVLHAFDQTPLKDNKEAIEALNKQIQVIRGKQGIDDEDRKQLRDLIQQRWQLQQQTRINPMIEIKDSKGATIVSGRGGVEDSTIGFKWEVPEGQAGGEYTVRVTYPWAGLAPAERTFDIRAYRPPRIKTQIDFLKDGYGPGDTVVATVEATRAEGGIPEGAKVTAIARIDGEEVARTQTMVRETGIAEVRFDLPDTIERGEGSLTFVIEDGGVVESASKTLPILLQTVDLAIYPEGGDLVAGVENKVYFEAKTPFGKPADISGDVLNRQGDKVAKFETTHEGRGRFSFTPKADEAYTLRVTKPSSVTEVFVLPEALVKGAVFTTSKGVYSQKEQIDITINNKERFIHSLTIRQRERVVAQAVLFDAGDVIPEKFTVTFQAMSDKQFAEFEAVAGKELTRIGSWLRESDDGILTITAYDFDGNPLAERLIYRAPKHHVNIEIVPDSAQYTPSGEVQLTIKTTDQHGNPVAAVTGVTVTDDAVLEMIETREQAPNLPAMVFLEQEVQDLADAHVYLDPNNEDAAEQLDLLLGTQGWRRFALVKLEDFIREYGDDARRLFAFRVPVKAEIVELRRNVGIARGAQADDALALRALADVEVAEAEAAFDAPEEGLKFAKGPVPPPNAASDQQQGQADPVAPEPAVGEAQLQEALNDAFAEREADGLIELGPAARERIAWQPMVFIREYAHKQPAGKPIGQRSDFTETVYWSSATKTDDSGLATITFDLSDSVTSFRVKADAFTKDGALGASAELIESVRPFYVEPKLPLELTAGDKVLLPIAMVNNTDNELGVELFLSKLGRTGTVDLDRIPLAGDTRGRALHELTIGQTYGELAFNIEARAGNYFDQNNRKLRVVPKGFPINDGSGGMLNPDSEIDAEITIPESTVPGSLSASVTVYPTPLANLTEALEALIRNPSGCFEQTSSTTFPLVMAQQYFMSHQGVDPELIARAKEKLDAGYKRLIGFETPDKGYEWFGSTPPHEALTAYGLLQFNEMKDVMDVDQTMIKRTQDWLMSRCGEDGSFQLDKKALDSFGRAPQDTTDAYIVWSLLEAGYDPTRIQKSVDLVLNKAIEGDDAYVITLGANIARLAHDEHVVQMSIRSVDASLPAHYKDIENKLLIKLANKLSDEGFIEGAITSITNSGGDALKIETTSLAILAWLKDDAYTQQVEKAILWLTERCKAGRFGSTQSTVLALKAIVEYDKARSTPKAPGILQLLVNGKPVGEPVKFGEETRGAIHLPAIAGHLTPGKHTIAVKMEGGSKMPYSIAVDYFADTPSSSEECKLRIAAHVSVDQLQHPDQEEIKELIKTNQPPTKRYPWVVQEGESTEINVMVTNVTKDGLPTPLAIVGIPGGLEPDFDQLKELVAVGKIAAFEVIGRDVVLYWREIKPEQVVDLSIRCTAAVPGTYTGPASRAYLYYTDEYKQWAEGLTVTITPRDRE